MRAERRERYGSGRSPQTIEIPEDIHITPRMYQKLTQKIAGKPEERILSYLMLRSLKQAQHEVREDALLRLAGNFLRQLLVHARRDVDVLGYLDGLRTAPAAVALAALGAHLHPLHRQRPDAQRIAEPGSDGLEVVNALWVGLLVDAVERGDVLVLQVAGDALVGRQHELLDDAVRDVALRARDALHQSVLVELDDRLRQIEV